MATLQIRANKSSAFLERMSDGLRVGAGQDDHLPATSSWDGHRERSAVGFPITASTWDDMAAVSKVELVLRSTGGGVHVGRGSSPLCYAGRITKSWTPNNASMDGGGSATTAGLVYPGPTITTTNQRTITYSGSGGDADVTEDITAIARVWMPSRLGGSGASCYGVRIDQGPSSNDTAEFYSAEVSTESWRPTLVITYTPLSAAVPGSPSLVAPAGTLVPAATFTFTCSSAMTTYDVQVSTDKSFATVTHWNAASATAGLAGGGKSVAVPYGGTALTPTAPVYWWRARGRNAYGAGAWAAPVSFTLDASGAQGDQLDAWAERVLADLATPRHHTILGTIVPRGTEVAQLAGTDYAGRWYVQDANHGAPIEAVVELVGMTLRADGSAGWSVDATTHDLGGAELLPPDYVPVSEDR